MQDPDIPPSERCRYKTEKEPTGPFDRQALLEYLETTAKEEKDWEEFRPYVKETRGELHTINLCYMTAGMSSLNPRAK